MIRLTLLFIVLLLNSITSSFAQKDLIRFNETELLKWSDFSGTIDSTSKFSAYALSYLGYDLIPFADGYILSTGAFLSPDSSWVRHRTEYGLVHENYHFKLTEIVRRRMLKEVYNMRIDVIRIHEIIDDRMNNYVLLHGQDQDYYDLETNYGRDTNRQEELENKIDSLLIDLHEYRFQYVVFFIENNVRVKERILTNDISNFVKNR